MDAGPLVWLGPDVLGWQEHRYVQGDERYNRVDLRWRQVDDAASRGAVRLDPDPGGEPYSSIAVDSASGSLFLLSRSQGAVTVFANGSDIGSEVPVRPPHHTLGAGEPAVTLVEASGEGGVFLCHNAGPPPILPPPPNAASQGRVERLSGTPGGRAASLPIEGDVLALRGAGGRLLALLRPTAPTRPAAQVFEGMEGHPLAEATALQGLDLGGRRLVAACFVSESVVLLALGSADALGVARWHLDTGQTDLGVATGSPARAGAFSRDGRYLACLGSGDEPAWVLPIPAPHDGAHLP